MASQNWNWLGAFFTALVWITESAFAQSLERFSFSEPHLGTIVELTLYAPEETVANEAARTAFDRVKELDMVFSDYKLESEAMRLCDTAGSGGRIKVSTELYRVLERAVAVSAQTDGAFDVTVGPLVALWRQARKEKRLPSDSAIAAAKEFVGWKLVSLDQSDRSVELKRSGMKLDFGGIAKGYIAQDVSRLLRERGFHRTLVAVAGDIVAGDPPPETDGWKIAVASLRGIGQAPNRLLRLKNCAISTSGDVFQFVEIDGKRYSHIVDPRTGFGLIARTSVTVIAGDGATADAIATAICIVGPERGIVLIEGSKQLNALILQATDTGVQSTESKGFHLLEVNSSSDSGVVK